MFISVPSWHHKVLPLTEYNIYALYSANCQFILYTLLILTPDDGMHDLPKYTLSQSIVFFTILNPANPRILLSVHNREIAST
jgi:hypothetical protein